MFTYKEIHGLIVNEIFDRPGIERRGKQKRSNYVNHGHFTDRAPTTTTPEPKVRKPIPKKYPSKNCQTCADLEVCSSKKNKKQILSSHTAGKLMCSTNRRYVEQDTIERFSNTALTHGKLLDSLDAVLSWEEIVSANSFDWVTFRRLSRFGNEAINYVYGQNNTHKETAWIMSGRNKSINSKKVDNLIRAAKTKLEQSFPQLPQRKTGIIRTDIPHSWGQLLDTLPYFKTAPSDPLRRYGHPKNPETLYVPARFQADIQEGGLTIERFHTEIQKGLLGIIGKPPRKAQGLIDLTLGTNYSTTYFRKTKGKEYALDCPVRTNPKEKKKQQDILHRQCAFVWRQARIKKNCPRLYENPSWYGNWQADAAVNAITGHISSANPSTVLELLARKARALATMGEAKRLARIALEAEYKNTPSYRGGRKKPFELDSGTQRVPRVWAEDRTDYRRYSFRWESSSIPVYVVKSRYFSVTNR